MDKSNWSDLPVDILIEIAHKLNYRGTIKFTLAWKSLIEDDCNWLGRHTSWVKVSMDVMRNMSKVGAVFSELELHVKFMWIRVFFPVEKELDQPWLKRFEAKRFSIKRKNKVSSSLMSKQKGKNIEMRSIDEPLGKEEENRMRRKREVDYEEEVPSLRRAIMVEKWIEDHGKKSSKHALRNSNGSNSSDSSCCGTLFSSSDNESSVTRSLQKSSSVHTMQTPKREKKFITTTKTKALQIYSELKKVKQPISPGGRIARLLNSIFSSKTAKKQNCNENLCSVTKSRSLKELPTSSYAASSFSTTCLSKAPCKIDSNGMKRAVRFSPVTKNIVGEDCKKKSVYKDDPRIVSFPVTRKPEKKIYNAELGDVPKYRETFHKADHEDFEDDNASCSSSDLFELDNIGVKYAEELPVYGTTKLKTNKDSANGYAF
ncbi:hypothetical protein POM88_024543 [Heracleum sosnowskyi]|uniref:Uncharacterized protein n=1 Tax=Heracleum sosnowskyi TaxID=360622 RepID=A0AAD8I283_9APIA|nr:hypothetical protein POM88_024543 [Heracleum sosnowskyi]